MVASSRKRLNPKRVPTLDPLEMRIREAARLHNAGDQQGAQRHIATLLLAEAARTSKALGLDGVESDIAWKWHQYGGMTQLATAAKSAERSGKNHLLARLRRSIKSRGIEFWRTEFKRTNRLAQFYFARFSRIVRRSRVLIEAAGYIALRSTPRCAPGNPDTFVLTAMTQRPPVAELRLQRYRVPKGSDPAYERWIVECLRLAGGKLKCRTLARLLATAHGEPVHWPGSSMEVQGRFDAIGGEPDEQLDDRLEELEREQHAWEQLGEE